MREMLASIEVVLTMYQKGSLLVALVLVRDKSQTSEKRREVTKKYSSLNSD